MNIISVKNLSKDFGQERVLKSVTRDFERGRIHGIVGNNGSGKTVFVMAQGLFQTLLVRLPMAYIMSIQPNASLTMIGLAAPTSTAVGVLLNVCFFLYLDRKAKKQG